MDSIVWVWGAVTKLMMAASSGNGREWKRGREQCSYGEAIVEDRSRCFLAGDGDGDRDEDGRVN